MTGGPWGISRREECDADPGLGDLFAGAVGAGSGVSADPAADADVAAAVADPDGGP